MAKMRLPKGSETPSVADFSALGALEGPAAGLISLFRNPEMRKLSTAKFLEMAKSLYPEDVWPQIEKLVAKFPRVAAHIELGDVPQLGESGKRVEGLAHVGSSNPTPGGRRYLVDINSAQTAQHGSPDVLAHEMTHVAQRLGNKDMPNLYGAAQKGIELDALARGRSPEMASQVAYLSNPLEQTARASALRKARGMTMPEPGAATRLRSLVQTNPDNEYFQFLDSILRSRGMK